MTEIPGFQDWLLVTQYYYPEPGAPQIRLRALAKELTRLGRRVTVLTGMPNYPDGVIHEGYRGKLRLTEKVDGIEVHRIWLYPAGGKNPFKRLSGFFPPAGYSQIRWTSMPSTFSVNFSFPRYPS